MFFMYFFTALLAIATVLQFAVDRAPDLQDSHDNAAARRVLIAGLAMMTLWMAYRCFEGIPSNPMPLFALTLIVLAEIAFCVNRLFPEFGSAVKRTAFLPKNRERRETWQ